DDALACVELGFQWLGFNCYKCSTRYLPPEAIAAIVGKLPPAVQTVGVFVNASAKEIEETLQQTGLHIAQLHGDESPGFAHALQAPWFRAFRVADDLAEEEIRSYGQELFLLDAAQTGQYGGTGHAFDWKVATRLRDHGKLLLAGGLRPDNVEEAVLQVRPFGVDVASGVESAPGRKDPQKVANFVTAVAQAEASW
ncbi:MAG: phosphoribosylanthranilate isomerase, partial [bacterium]